MVKLTSRDGAITFAVRVQPRASQTEIVGSHDGALKVRLAAPPVDGKANEELIRFLAKLFETSRQQISILSGPTSKNKLVRVDGIAALDGERLLVTAIGD